MFVMMMFMMMMFVMGRLARMLVLVLVLVLVMMLARRPAPVLAPVFGRARLAGQMDIEFRRRNPAAVDALQAQLVTFDAEFQQLAPQQFKIKPAIQQRAEQHVAARPGEAVQ